MSIIRYKNLLDLAPVKLDYTYKTQETLKQTLKHYINGLSYYSFKGFNNFQDLAINKNSCFVLTSAISLQNIFTNNTKLEFGDLPVTVQIQSQQSLNQFANYNLEKNVIENSSTPINFLIYRIPGTNLVEIKVNTKYLQVDANYPYQVRLNDKPLDTTDIHRQQFECVYLENNLITLKTKTDQGFRYLSFTQDKTMKATGIMLNNAPIHNYFLKIIPVTSKEIDFNFKPNNSWVTYYQDFKTQAENGSVTVKENYPNTPINFLIDFTIKNIPETNSGKLNIANLKTNYTPAGGPAPTNNLL
jgi:hypothetical protein